MNVETLDSKSAKGITKIMNPEFRRQVQVAEELQEKNDLTMLTAKADRLHDRRLQAKRCSEESYNHSAEDNLMAL